MMRREISLKAIRKSLSNDAWKHDCQRDLESAYFAQEVQAYMRTSKARYIYTWGATDQYWCPWTSKQMQDSFKNTAITQQFIASMHFGQRAQTPVLVLNIYAFVLSKKGHILAYGNCCLQTLVNHCAGWQ